MSGVHGCVSMIAVGEFTFSIVCVFVCVFVCVCAHAFVCLHVCGW